MNKTIISIVAMLCITGLIGWYTYLQNSRFTVVGTKEKIAYEIDRKTGESWTIFPGSRIKNIADDKKEEKFQTLPIEEKNKVKKIKATSKSKEISLDQMISKKYGGWDNELSGNLYNGSSWTVRRIMIKVNAIEKDGSIKWKRQFRAFTSIQPLTTGTFTIGMHGDSNISLFEWDLVQVDGTPTE